MHALNGPKPSVASASELHLPLCRGCQEFHSLCEFDRKTPVVTATPMTRPDVSGLPGWQPSFSQSRQTGHALFSHYPSTCPLSLILVRKLVNSSTKHMRQWVPSHSIWALIRQFQLNQILKCLPVLWTARIYYYVSNVLGEQRAWLQQLHLNGG